MKGTNFEETLVLLYMYFFILNKCLKSKYRINSEYAAVTKKTRILI